MEVSKVGEFGLIERLEGIAGAAPDGETWIGDDAAVLRAPAGTILMTTDLLVEGVHFDLTLTGPEDLGYKAISVNASDIAAMGGSPRRAVVGLVLRPTLDVSWVESLYRGMRACCDEFNCAVVGGDISRGDCLAISVAMIGNPAGRLVIHRSGARVGDLICVTGTLGRSAAGYRLLISGRGGPTELIGAHLRPRPRVNEVQTLRGFLPSAMIDISDGLAADLKHLCDASSVGALIDEAWIPTVDTTGLDLDRGPTELALRGGEDYELCFTIPPGRAKDAAAAVTAATGTIVSVIGEIVDAGMTLRRRDGVKVPLDTRAWDHLKS